MMDTAAQAKGWNVWFWLTHQNRTTFVGEEPISVDGVHPDRSALQVSRESIQHGESQLAERLVVPEARQHLQS